MGEADAGGWVGESAEPTPLRVVSPGRAAFVLPATPRAAFALLPLTVDQIGQRAAPPVLRCGGTVLNDEARYSPRVA